jgi:serine/threonine protein kinase
MIGQGGMGQVFRATDSKLHRPVAIKFLSEEIADMAARRRFQREAQMASSLNHPHIVTVYDVGEFEGRQFLVTEFIDGGTLKDWAAKVRPHWREAVELLMGIADGLATAHEANILHRDIKPANILITKSGYAKLADFGLAKLNDPLDEATLTATATAGETKSGVIVGTIAYMSPEQAGGKNLDARSDIFSFGVVLYELLAGRRPFAGTTDLEVLQKIVHAKADALAETIPPLVRAVAEKALEKDPRDRYQSMREMVVDLRRLVRHSDEISKVTLVPALSGRKTIMVGSIGILAVLVIALVLWFNMRNAPAQLPSRNDWVQLTNFPDSVTQPALSPDGRMVTFIRGPNSFLTPGQVYVKLLPDGEPKQLTNTELRKVSPVFSPDSSRIAFTTGYWDTWVVPVLGGEPTSWLPNASGLMWHSRNRITFSEIIDRLEGNHMKVVTAEESRAGERDVYIPQPKGAMAHRSYSSPDGKWVVLAEMTDRGLWLPCRLVPIDGSSAGRQIGPPQAPCLFAQWTPDGNWIYLSSQAGGVFHIWRQRFSAAGELASPEQVTSGPTSEEGLAMSPDGRFFITAVGTDQSSVWIHDSRGDRQVSLEGYALQPTFSPDGTKLFYILLKNSIAELWFADLKSGHTEALLPNFQVGGDILSSGYDVSKDGKFVVFEARGQNGKQALWLAAVDRRSSPRTIPNVEGDSPIFTPDGDVVFRAREGTYGSAYRVRPDGTGLKKLLDYPVIETRGISGDGKWLVVYARYAPPGGEMTGATLAFPLEGGPPMYVFGPGSQRPVEWSADGKTLFLVPSEGTAAMTFAVPLPPGRMWPEIPKEGLRSEADFMKLPGVTVIHSPDSAPGPVSGVYAFVKQTVQRNLYKIPIR